MRAISMDKDYFQIFVIVFLTFLYFLMRGLGRFPTFIVNFALTLGFFYYVGKLFSKKTSFSSLLMTISYSLFPTLIWFSTTALLALLLPPPRTPSLMGKSFSVLYVAFSLALLWWKIMLVYLAVRFSLKLQFYRVSYTLLLYTICLLSLTYIAYVMGYSKVPFI